MFRLPISKREVLLRPPTGHEDVLLVEAAELGVRSGLALLQRLVQAADGEADWGELVVTDYEALLLALHRAAFGEEVRASVVCSGQGCGSLIEVSFGVEAYLTHHQPRIPRTVEAVADRPGWFQWKGNEVLYRLPVMNDLAAVAYHPHAERELMRRCTEGDSLGAAWQRRLERAMEMQAPSLSQELEGHCTSCRRVLRFFFDVERFVLAELCDQAAFVFADTHLLALHYHWPESQILNMPRDRRIQYAEMLRSEA